MNDLKEPIVSPADSLVADFTKVCIAAGASLQTDVGLDKHTSFRIGGPAKLFLEIANRRQLEAVFSFKELALLNPKLIGGGSNLLISSREYPGLILKLSDEFSQIEETSAGVFRIGGSARSALTSKRISKWGYPGIEFLSTIPGTVGGAVIQNAGCYGGELFDFIDTVTYFDGKELITKNGADVDYGYRYTEFLDSDKIVVDILLKPFSEHYVPDSKAGERDYQNILERLDECMDKRRNSQPKNKKSAGSIFKNPKGDKKAWQYIDEVGLRSTIQGGAKISDEHTNFIVNTGGASSEDVLYLIQLMEKNVKDRFGLELEREVELVGLFR